MKTWLLFLAGAPLLVYSSLHYGLWVRDIRDDRKPTIIVNGSTPILAGSGGKCRCHGTCLTTVDRGTQLRVERIRYLKDCATVDVILPDGRKRLLGIGRW